MELASYLSAASVDAASKKPSTPQSTKSTSEKAPSKPARTGLSRPSKPASAASKLDKTDKGSSKPAGADDKKSLAKPARTLPADRTAKAKPAPKVCLL